MSPPPLSTVAVTLTSDMRASTSGRFPRLLEPLRIHMPSMGGSGFSITMERAVSQQIYPRLYPFLLAPPRRNDRNNYDLFHPPPV